MTGSDDITEADTTSSPSNAKVVGSYRVEVTDNGPGVPPENKWAVLSLSATRLDQASVIGLASKSFNRIVVQ